jgi:NTP pyrophosphatase (non-canonical NTP hydrolase)
MTNLSFNTLRGANTARLPQFKNRKGEQAHANADGSDWSLNDWGIAVTGELGEAASILKQIRRGDLSLDEARESLGKELADVLIYLDLLAIQCGIDLGKATRDKFNEVSLRVNSTVFITLNDTLQIGVER